jgi:hypothetical protein
LPSAASLGNVQGYLAESNRPRTRRGVTSLDTRLRDAARALAEEGHGVTSLRFAFNGSPRLHERLACSRNAGAGAVGAREQSHPVPASRFSASAKDG